MIQVRICLLREAVARCVKRILRRRLRSLVLLDSEDEEIDSEVSQISVHRVVVQVTNLVFGLSPPGVTVADGDAIASELLGSCWAEGGLLHRELLDAYGASASLGAQELSFARMQEDWMAVRALPVALFLRWSSLVGVHFRWNVKHVRLQLSPFSSTRAALFAQKNSHGSWFAPRNKGASSECWGGNCHAYGTTSASTP